MQKIANFPGSYQYENVSMILSELDLNSSMTIISPSGFSKSYILRFLAFNKNYRSNYSKKLRNVEFVYVDLNGVVLENNILPAQWQELGYTKERFAIEAVNGIIQRSLLEKLNTTRGINSSAYEILPNSMEQTSKLIDELVNLYKNKVIFIILDNAEKILEMEYIGIGNFLNYLRDKYKRKIDYIFSLNNTKYLNNLNVDGSGKLSRLLSMKIVYLKLVAIELHQYFDWDNNVIHKFSPSFRKKAKEKLDLINKLSGGYMPYGKYLFKESNFDKMELGYELILKSKDLLSSFTESQINLLKNISQIQATPQNQLDFNYLLQTRVIRKAEDGYELFSPIFARYLDSISNIEG